eukprot:1877348-Pyramimonas_sp.AAC.1
MGALLGSLLLSGVLRLAADGDAVVLEVPLSKGGGVDLDDGALHQGLSTHQLVVGGVVGNIQNTALAGRRLRGPGDVARVETQSAELPVAATAANRAHQGVHARAAQLGVGSGAAELVLALLAPSRLLAAGCATLVQRVTRDTHGCSR